MELLSLSLSIGRILKNRDKHQFKFQVTTSFHLANQEKFRVGKIQINTTLVFLVRIKGHELKQVNQH